MRSTTTNPTIVFSQHHSKYSVRLFDRNEGESRCVAATCLMRSGGQGRLRGMIDTPEGHAGRSLLINVQQVWIAPFVSIKPHLSFRQKAVMVFTCSGMRNIADTWVLCGVGCVGNYVTVDISARFDVTFFHSKWTSWTTWVWHLSKWHKTHKYTEWAKCGVSECCSQYYTSLLVDFNGLRRNWLLSVR
jgi:hypothetical protein